MSTRLLLVALKHETDIVLVRKRARKIAELVGFDAQDQTRITTAVSEITRNAFEYAGGGQVEFRLSDATGPRMLMVVISDKGPGILDVRSILEGSHRSATGMGLGIVGARRLLDRFEIESGQGAGTTVTLGKTLPPRAPAITKASLARIAQALTVVEGLDPLDEIRQQNQEMLFQLQELQKRQEELTELNHKLRKREEELSSLNQELQDTNRGVVALFAELDERADHLRRADELKSRFLSNMSHEFRTPLNSILALSRLLLGRSDGDLAREQEKQVQFIRKAAENLTELVNDLLDLAKVEAGKTVVTAAEFRAESLFGALRGMLRPLLVGDALDLIFEDASGIPPLVSDEAKVSQLLRNFISNAIKFTDHGEVTVWARDDATAGTVTFGVRDSGIGIAEEDFELIFQEFTQVAHAKQSRVKGTGLGLPLSRKLAELLGGKIAMKSRLGEGSLFTVTIPRIYREPAETPELEAKWVIEPGRIPILTVEDNPADAFAFERSLAGSRYQVIPASTVAEARRALERIQPAAVLLDVILVGQECWSLLVELKQRAPEHAMPVVVVSSGLDERKARDLGAEDYMQKPVEPAQLLAVLDWLTADSSVTRVLLIDDEQVSRYVIRQFLQHGAYELREAENGAAGLQQLRAIRPDIILVDVNMPQMDGYEFLGRLADEANAERVPAIVLTSMVLDEEQRGRLGWAAGVVSKVDLSAATLTAAIASALGQTADDVGGRPDVSAHR